jgi:hypothetical protein
VAVDSSLSREVLRGKSGGDDTEVLQQLQWLFVVGLAQTGNLAAALTATVAKSPSRHRRFVNGKGCCHQLSAKALSKTFADLASGSIRSGFFGVSA